jgi:hypothetical protein
MTFDPQAVDIFTSDVAPSVTCRLCVGYVIDNRRYYLRKVGALSPKRAGADSDGGCVMEHLNEKVVAHEAALTQMNERLGNIEARLTGIDARMATKGKLRAWADLVSSLIAIAVGVMLKFG